MRSRLLSCLLLLVALGGGLAAPAHATTTGSAVTCIRHVFVTLLVYSDLPTPLSNTCWSYERPVQGNWYILRTDGHVTNPGSTNGKWVYDDTNPQHTDTLNCPGTNNVDTCRLLQAASGRSYGYELMAYRSGTWKKLNPNNVVTRYFGEIYSGQTTIDDLFSVWVNNPTIGRPMINISTAAPNQTYAALLHLCRSVSSGTYIGVYSSTPVNDNNGQLAAVEGALNDCTA